MKFAYNNLEVKMTDDFMTEPISEKSLSSLYRAGNAGFKLELDKNNYFQSLYSDAQGAALIADNWTLTIGQEVPSGEDLTLSTKGILLDYEVTNGLVSSITLRKDPLLARIKDRIITLRPLKEILEAEMGAGEEMTDGTYRYATEYLEVLLMTSGPANMIVARGVFDFLGVPVGLEMYLKDLYNNPYYSEGRLICDETIVVLCTEKITTDIGKVNSITIMFKGDSRQ